MSAVRDADRGGRLASHLRELRLALEEEQQARAEYGSVDTYSSEFRILKHTLTDNQERTLMKLVVDAESDRVLGAHMVGADAAEIMQGVAIAIKAGARKADFDATVGIHPSSAEEFCTMRTKD